MNNKEQKTEVLIAEIENADTLKVRKRFSAYAFQLKNIEKKKEGGK